MTATAAGCSRGLSTELDSSPSTIPPTSFIFFSEGSSDADGASLASSSSTGASRFVPACTVTLSSSVEDI